MRLLDAVRASCAVPGVFPSVTIAGRRYADGGLRSPFNADLASGSAVVVVLSPLRLNAYVHHLLEAEIASLDDATVHVSVADEASLAAIGADLLSTGTAAAAVDAGRDQAAREGNALRSICKPASRIGADRGRKVLVATQASILTATSYI